MGVCGPGNWNGGAQKCVSYVDPERCLERNQNDTLNDTPCVAWKTRARPSFQHPLEKQVAERHIKNSHSPCRRSIPQAVVLDTHTRHYCVLADPLVHDGSMRFEKHPFETQVVSWHIKTSRSPYRRSILQALVRDTHTWHHCVLADPLLHDGSMRFDKHPFETQVVSWHIKTSHCPSGRSIPQAPTRDAHQWQHTYHIKTSHPPSRRSIRRAPTRDAHQWRHTTSKPAAPHLESRRSIPQAPTRDAHQWQHTTSKPAIPHLDARFDEHPLETHISGSTPHQNQPFPIWTLDSTSALSRHTSMA